MSMLMQLGTRAMFAAYAQLQTTGQNIANANTKGYSRQQVTLGTAEGQYTGAGYFGRGVTVQTVTRATNIFLTNQAAATKATASSDSARLDMLQQLEQVFGLGESGVGYAATSLFNAFSDLAAAPGDMSARQSVLARAEDFASLARSSSDQLETMQANVVNDVRNSVSDINEIATQLANLNSQIVVAQGGGHSPNDLLDARDRLINDLSAKIEVQTVVAPDGSTSIFVGGGQSLVLGGKANQLVARDSDYDRSRVSVGISIAGYVSPINDDRLGGGSLEGLIKFQNSDLVEARNRLGQIVSSLTTAVNQQQSYGIDLTGTTGSDMFTVGQPMALAHNRNTSVPPGAVTLTRVDPTALKASEYELEEDRANPGTWKATRLSDGYEFTGLTGSGEVIDGFSITFSSPPTSGDSFLLKPVSTAGLGAKTALTSPKGIAAGIPLTASTPATNTGTMTIGQFEMVSTPTVAPVTVAFTNNTGDYEIRDSGNAVLTSGTWDGLSPISYNGFSLVLKGVPKTGDTVAINPTTVPASSNGNALTFDNMASRAMIDGRTVTDAYAETLSEMGVRVQGASAAAETSNGVAQRNAEALSGETGVNLDEEAAHLIQYQQAYQAAAKMLQTAQAVMDTLMQLGR